MIKQKVSIELGVGDSDLDLDQTRPQDMNVTGIPNHVVLLSSQKRVVLQQSNVMESHKKIPESMKQAIEECGISPETEFRSVIAELQEIGGNWVRQMKGLQATTTENESSATKIEEQEQSNTTSYQVKLH